jgi:peptidoglycan/LPS O-acetylase OafA/YrhL
MGIWAQASEVAEATPTDRNRYVDFLRAISIMFVISGHWLITTAHYDADAGTLNPILALDIIPWTSWLTWLFQVMPIFFIVGGYSNAVSLEGARKNHATYAQWLTGRLHRLLTPLLLLVIAWAGISFVLHFTGAAPETITFLSRTALVPTWFLAIYILIVLLAPATYALWRRWGFVSLAGYILLAALVDFAFFQFGWKSLGWTNYFWVWLGIHHLGFAWRDGRLGNPPVLLAISLVSLLALMAMIFLGPYPIAMAGSPGDEVSNTLPPKVTLIALGMFQFGLLLSIEKPMQRILSGLRTWTCTVIINTMIMTIYLWHMTILLAVFALSYFSRGFGLSMEPGLGEWWWTRPIWLMVLAVLLIPVALLLSPLERVSRPKDTPTPASWRLIVGAIMAGLGITLATLFGFDGNLFSITSTGTIALVLGGAWICGLSINILAIKNPTPTRTS